MYHSKNKVLDAAGTFLFLLMYILFACPFVCLFPERYIFPTSILLNCLNINAKLDVSESLFFTLSNNIKYQSVSFYKSLTIYIWYVFYRILTKKKLKSTQYNKH